MPRDADGTFTFDADDPVRLLEYATAEELEVLRQRAAGARRKSPATPNNEDSEEKTDA